MPCRCAVGRVPGTANTNEVAPLKAAAPTVLSGGSFVDAENSDNPASSAPRCFYCLCSVCGQELADVPTVTCDACGSQTHITCARDAYSNEWLCNEVAATSTAATGACGAASLPDDALDVERSRRMPSAAPASHDGEGTGSSPTPAVAVAASSGLPLSSPLGRESSQASLLLPSHALRSAAARIDKMYNYYCHPDCAMGMEVLRNPQFHAALSRKVERAFEREWARVRESLVSAGVLHDRTHKGDATDDDACGKEKLRPPLCPPVKSPSAAPVKEESLEDNSAASSCCPSFSSPTPTPCPGVPERGARDCASSASAASICDMAACHPAVALEVLRLYHQLRAEAWAVYFEQERHHYGHPLFYPPPFLDIARDAAVGHVVAAASPQGQAARLYLLDCRTHPVGSMVAIPVGALTRWQQPAAAPLIKENDSNNFVAESLERIVKDVVVPETVVVYQKCSKEGRVLT
ncbi:hypothetical protein LSCM1_00947 [Leishmania martiniquensis]|uniref:Uncharacterized protein n=1 Tax=Leishmania martiniquensis TaxID=1580590 RepID=A0A836GJR9_9TRYP|nr:hypothetical protein LSCM1_00947 [Leishmania martiniquensis]